MDVRGKVPARIESDLDCGIVVSRSFQHVEQPIDTERVPIAQRGRSAGPVPRPQRLATANLHQQPAPHSRAEAARAHQKPIVRRTAGSPQRAFPSERCAQGVTLPPRLQTEGSCFGQGDDGAGVLEEVDDAACVLDERARTGILGGEGSHGDSAVTGDDEAAGHQQFRPGDPDARAITRQLH